MMKLGSPLPSTHRWLAVLGLVLYALSWVTPSIDGRQIGAQAFAAAMGMGARLTFGPAGLRDTLVGICLLLGWLANFSIAFRMSVRARLFWIAASWLPFVVLWIKYYPVASPVTLLFYYPWAIGIALVHIANIADGRRIAS